MADRNSSRVREFVFMGFSDHPEMAAILFALFLVNYLITILGNLGILILIRVDASLHTPMYFFLSNLSFLDICYSTTISPRLLTDLLMEKKVITFNECIIQFYFYITFATTECYLLAAMAYDRYMAICSPLTYTITMSHKACVCLVAGSYIAGSVNSMIHTGCLTRLSFCGPNVIDHFFCEGPPLFQLSCSDTSVNLYMADRNSSRVKVFVLMGFSDRPEMAAILFALFLVNYLITIVGNLGILMLIRVDARLHTPMYFFLSNLSFLDICYSTTISPRLLTDLLMEKKVITFNECLVQFYFYITFATTECYLLAAMAYDRYMAICSPLTYTITMSHKACVSLVAGSYIAGSVNSMIHTGCLTRLSFCGPNVIDHFFCEGPPLFQLSCSDTSINLYVMFAFAGFNLVSTHLTVLISYTYIFVTILRIRSAEGRHKAFSTCSSHLLAVIILYGSLIFIYLQPNTSTNGGKVTSLLYAVVIPMLNPLIYSLRNKDVKSALTRVLEKHIA
ncbi:olfactory receptor 5AP2-like isoform X1 [Zootoca vivipara]|uniref:olfactory receptor 5AP2-like isoform X1 n=1 Tax=Zootoca vivipara TaxID=8524 RepID=UPI00293BFF26|nr:olfactory receptor 5AP2-like isoform X1 [Zootoca vivipara]